MFSGTLLFNSLPESVKDHYIARTLTRITFENFLMSQLLWATGLVRPCLKSQVEKISKLYRSVNNDGLFPILFSSLHSYVLEVTTHLPGWWPGLLPLNFYAQFNFGGHSHSYYIRTQIPHPSWSHLEYNQCLQNSHNIIHS